jgi:heme exporter protein B
MKNRSTAYWRAVWTITRKDLQAEARAWDILVAMLLFAILAVVIFSFALELNRQARQDTVGGVLWVTLIFAGMLGLARSMAVEKDKGSLDALLIAPIARSALFYGKMLSNLIFTLLISFLLMVLLTVLFNITLLQPLIMGVILMGCVGFTASGTLLSSLTVYAKGRDNLLPIVLLPVILPIILCGVRATNALLAEQEQAEWLPWIQLLAAVDIFFLVGSFFLFDYIVEE